MDISDNALFSRGVIKEAKGVHSMDLMVCVGSSCHLQHSRELIDRLKALIAENGLEGKVELKGSFCMGHCAEEGVCVKFDDQVYSLTLDTVDGFFASKVVARQESR